MDVTLGKKTSLAERVENLVPFVILLTIVVSVLLAFARLVWGEWDKLGWVLISVVVSCIVFCKNVDHLDRVAKTGLLSSMFIAATCSLFWVAKSDSGIWVNPATKETTLSTPLLAVTPFQSSLYFVELHQPQRVKVKAITSDGIPLTCETRAVGIMLNKENGGLGKLLVAEREQRPEARISAELGSEINSATEQVVASKSNLEIIQLRQFYIPYHVGSKLSNTLSSLGLKWSDGRVSVSCEVIFNS